MKISLLFTATLLLICVNAGAEISDGKHHKGGSYEEGASDGAMVRELVHACDHVVFGGKFPTPELKDYVGAGIQIVADGSKEESTGIPYFFMNKEDTGAVAARKDEQLSVYVDGDINRRCEDFPMRLLDVQCPRAELFGKLKQVDINSDEGKVVCKWIEEKYPIFKELDDSKKSQYELWKMDIRAIKVWKNGVPTGVSVDEYFNASPAKWINA